MRLRKISLVAILGAGLSGSGAAFLAFGPDLLVNFMSQDDNRARDEAALRQNQLLERNALLLEGLANTLHQRPAEITAAQTAPATPTPVPVASLEPEATPEPVAIPESITVPKPEHEPVTAEQQPPPPQVMVGARGGDRSEPVERAPVAVPSPPAAAPAFATATVSPTAPAEVIVSFGVYPGQTFDLCGHANFTAEIVTADPTARVSLRSTDRAIPGAGFRGFEARLPLREAAKLWEGCTVAIDLSEGAGTTRIAISTSRGTP